jgi:UDP-glucose 4-epimerase
MNRDISPVIYGDGLQRRDFTHVSDIVEGCCLAKKKLDKKPICGIFNLGTGKNYDLNELIKILNKTLDKNIKPTYIQNPIKNYVRDTLADTTKAKRELGFVAKIGLEEGIRKLAKTN